MLQTNVLCCKENKNPELRTYTVPTHAPQTSRIHSQQQPYDKATQAVTCRKRRGGLHGIITSVVERRVQCVGSAL